MVSLPLACPPLLQDGTSNLANLLKKKMPSLPMLFCRAYCQRLAEIMTAERGHINANAESSFRACSPDSAFPPRLFPPPTLSGTIALSVSLCSTDRPSSVVLQPSVA